jgi:flagellar hook-associated protein FlgK
MRRQIFTGTLILAFGFAPAFLQAAPKATAPGDSEQVSQLLSEAKTLAFQVKEDALEMETFTRMEVSWQSHVVAINQIKEHINALGKQVAKLKAAESGASPWQATAINRINPYLDELTGYTTAVIERLNGDRKHTLADYKDYLEANADYATDLAAMIANFVDYGNSRARVEQLGDKLEVPGR